MYFFNYWILTKCNNQRTVALHNTLALKYDML